MLPPLQRFPHKDPLCGDLICGTGGNPHPYKKCLRLVKSEEKVKFVTAKVTLVQSRLWNLCWARPNGVRLLGGFYSHKGRFCRSRKLN